MKRVLRSPFLVEVFCLIRYNENMKRIFGIALGMLMLIGLCAPVVAKIQCPGGSVRGRSAQVNSLAECNIEKTETGNADDIVSKYAGRAINILFMIVGIAAVVVIIIAGVMMMTSQGDAAKIKTAKSAIIYAIIGLLIALAAFMIVNFILDNVFK